MSTSPRGEYTPHSLLVRLTKFVSEHSLTKIYTGLCESCVRAIKTCERSSLACPKKASQMKSPNRFASLNLSTSHIRLSSAEKRPNGGCDDCGRQGQTVAAEVDVTPRLIDDHLGDAFEIRKDIQVH